jgi:putative ABC transport system permease protein
MLTNYLKIALKVFLRRKFFTLISLFGISFTLVVLMVATAILDHAFAPLPPEVNQDRTLIVVRASMFGDRSFASSSAGYRLLDRYARNLPGAERMSILSRPQTVYAYPNGNKVRIDLKRTDGDFWRILRFDFIEGAPYTAQDVDEARYVAVITETTRERLVGKGPALGRTIEVDGQRFRVVGVVQDVPWLRQVPYAEMWVPITTAKSDSYKSELLGSFYGLVLARDRSAMPAIQEEFRARLARVELPDPKTYKKLMAPLETTFDQAARSSWLGNPRDEDSHAGRLWAVIIGSALLFMLLPTVNLINLNVSRIMERASEIGVRKAFGASSHTLVGQFVVENVILTLVGGAVGLFLSFLVLRAITASDFLPYANLTLNYRVFLYGLGLALFFGVFSGVYPAWRMSRLNPVQALKGASR